MTKVTLLGDSIRLIGYGPEVPKLLGEGFEVYQPEDNCRFAKYLLRGLFNWRDEMSGTRIMHFNSGLWDICDIFGDGTFTTEAEYVETMLRIADIMLRKYDKVIFATTTPVSEKNQYNKNSDIERFNKLIVPLYKEKGIIINDLYTTVASDIDRYISEDTIHLSKEGIEVCAKQVADIIKETAKTLDKKETCTAESSDSTGAPV
ncbi:MAG: SGNH/GDSL hydrolase family protein [Clostridia bacterium]|nr:SGNH/GDSL hydrolase family protein [Clostridia bacterium]